MKGLKVVNVGSNPEYTQFGTCEVCFSWGEADNPYMVIEFPNGDQVQIDTFEWDWGDYYPYYVDNVIDFSAWLSEQEIEEEFIARLRKRDSSVLINLIQSYKWDREEAEDG
ncbi:hypothetical protein JEQ21_09375 [Streptococcus sp. 121]|uniref:hypothetical protein n=1 Tax=Streptococcus sp. 121 TaxID=2797637 RepID=UPI0018F0F9FF|nr:hypothetical protein [Streptococcus sp. 121]MBJ6746649.1 hypothetical protein [Streptococcus sp. 121]